MEIRSKILNSRLVEIKKKDNLVRLFFIKNQERRVLRIEGLIFETLSSPLNKEVKNVEISQFLGIKAVSQLRYENKNPNDYKQLLIQMDGFNEWKSELICAFKSLKFE